MLNWIDRAGRFLVLAGAVLLGGASAQASDFSEPWKRADRALVIDAYEYNPIDWNRLVGDKRIVGFINKGSDGLSPPYKCGGNATEVRLCKALWKRHAVARELFHTRRMVAKTLGLKWGAYHLARPGNPIDQANNFIDFAEPAKDDLIALDIEDNDPGKWMSLEDAETFARHIHTRLGRWPVLYTNGSTALHIAEKREKYKILSRLPLWYARYKPAIGLHFPKGNWETYTLWQFAAGANCDARSCPYRVPGTPLDIDVNVASMGAQELRNAWPFGELIDKKDFPASDRISDPDMVADADPASTVPLPVARSTAIEGGDVSLQFAALESAEPLDAAKADAALTVANADAMHPQAVEKAEALVEKEIVELTGETIPTPVSRAEAKKKRGDVTVRFVAVERVVVKAEMVETVLAAAVHQSPFHSLLGKDAEPELPVVMTNYVAATEIARRLRVRATILEQSAAAAAPAGIKPARAVSGSVSTAALDDPSPIRSATSYSRKDLPIFLLRRIDGPDEAMP